MESWRGGEQYRGSRGLKLLKDVIFHLYKWHWNSLSPNNCRGGLLLKRIRISFSLKLSLRFFKSIYLTLYWYSHILVHNNNIWRIYLSVCLLASINMQKCKFTSIYPTSFYHSPIELKKEINTKIQSDIHLLKTL